MTIIINKCVRRVEFSKTLLRWHYLLPVEKTKVAFLTSTHIDMSILNSKCRFTIFNVTYFTSILILAIAIFKGDTLSSLSLGASCPTLYFPKNWFLECQRRISMTDDQLTSIHSKHIAEVHDVPVSVLIRPFVSVLDEAKVRSLMETLQVSSISIYSL